MRPPVHLVTGPEEVLVRREADRLLAELREEAGGEIELTDVRAAELGEGGLPDLRTASLFGAPRVVRIRDAQELRAEHAAALTDLLGAPPVDATVLLTAKGTGSIQKLAAAVKEAGGRIDCKPPPDFDAKAWQRLVADELARHGLSGQPAALQALLDHAGHDVGTIAAKVAELARVVEAGRVGADDVEATIAGHGNKGAFAVADAMCERDPARAVTLLRGSLEAGEQPLMILGALAYRVRALVAAGGGLVGRTDAKEQRARIGFSVSKGQLGHLERHRKAFGPGELTTAYRTLAEADLALKGSDLEPGAVLEQAVAAIATRR
ncbi:MAG: DNA polymerase III subunit delta [Actinomycetota bacterium]